MTATSRREALKAWAWEVQESLENTRNSSRSWVERRQLGKKKNMRYAWQKSLERERLMKFLGNFLENHEVPGPRMTQLIMHIKGHFPPPSSPEIKNWWTHQFLVWAQTHFHVPVLEMVRCGWWNLLNLLFMWVSVPAHSGDTVIHQTS